MSDCISKWVERIEIRSAIILEDMLRKSMPSWQVKLFTWFLGWLDTRSGVSVLSTVQIYMLRSSECYIEIER